MDATTTPSTPFDEKGAELIKKLRITYPKLHFLKSDVCRWSPSTRTVYYRKISANDDIYNLLHEVAHAVLKHTGFDSDMELVQKEMQAWNHAVDKLGPLFDIEVPREFAETEIDTYREWIHQRSTCPDCGQNGLQTKTDIYRCLNCKCQWRVNDARQCGLKRYKLSSA